MLKFSKIKKYIENQIEKKNYMLWIKKNEPTEIELNKQEKKSFKYMPLISIIVPMHNTNKKYLEELIESIKGQTYSNWELCIADGSERKESYIDKLMTNNKIKYVFLNENKGIAENTNKALELASGEYYAFLDHDDLLPKFALYEVIKSINENLDADFFYSDEDKILEDSKHRLDPYFKPEFSEDTLFSYNYICHFTIIKKELFNKVNGFRKEYDGSQDYDLILRATELSKKIVHISKILYHWRINNNSVALDSQTKPYAYIAAQNVIQDYMKNKEIKTIVEQNEKIKGAYNISYILEDKPLVSIILNLSNEKILEKVVNSIRNSSYKNLEVWLINREINDNLLKKYNDIKIIKTKDHYAKANNSLMNIVNGEYVAFLDNTEILTNNWIERMLGYFQRDKVGIVGTKILYKNKKVYSNGIVFNKDNELEHLNKNLNMDSTGYMGINLITHNVTATSNAFMLRKSEFNFVGGFDEKIYTDFCSDIELCFKFIQRNKLVLIDPSILTYYYKKGKFLKKDIDTIKNIKLNKNIKEIYLNKNLKCINGFTSINHHDKIK